MEKRTNSELLDLYYFGYKKIPKYEIDNLEKIAIENIKNVLRNYKRIVTGYSLGKDSIVIDNLMIKSGLQYHQAYFRTTLNFDEIIQWYEDHKSNNSAQIIIPRPNYNDLIKDEKMLFPLTVKEDTKWMSYKWKVQKEYLTKYGCDVFVTGRRLAEHNRCGSKKDNYLVKGKIYDTLSPIAEWSIEQVMAYIRYNNLELPPNYLNYPNGFVYGSGAWAERTRYNTPQNTIIDMWKEVYDIDKKVVYQASEYLPSAKEFLKIIKNKGE